ncbi:MAG: primosomal protein N' [Opitutales bacterium]
MSIHIAKLILFNGFDKELSYEILPEHLSQVKVGSVLRVPLRNKLTEGIVCEVEELTEAPAFKMKPVHSVQSLEAVFTPELFELAKWISSYYASPMSVVIDAMIPAVVKSGKRVQSVFELRLAPHIDEEFIKPLEKKAKAQFQICNYLLENKAPIQKASLAKILKVSLGSINALIEKGVLIQSDMQVLKNAFDDEIAKAEIVKTMDFDLNEGQGKALEDIANLLDKKEFSPHLLYGVTGSGKTEVYIRAMRKVLEEGGQCVFLVPEISLTPQTVGRLRSKLNLSANELVVWHSNLSDGQRLQAWESMLNSTAKVVVGARSCIFSPLKNLRLIIVDEEHDPAYKQENNPRYNARDVAVYRAMMAKAVVLLGSATPALETLYNVKNTKYTQSLMKERIDNRSMPKVMLVDMKREKVGAVFSNLLRSKILDRLDKKEQSILFLNRRGYSKLFQCPDCGYVATCPNCSISLTWHRREDFVMCHLCGHKEKAQHKCPECASDKAKWKNFGTQKVEEIIAKTFPHARVARIDADTMKRKDSYREIFGEFRKGNIDMLIGTQMIAKGLDFPNVTLVGVLNADISLNMQDFRANERTFQLIVQVSGRAGRGTNSGEVVIQTLSPDAPPIQYARRDNMQDFLEEELRNRMQFSYPPSKRLIRQVFRSRNPDKLQFYSEQFAKKVQLELGDLAFMRGPCLAPIEKIQEYYRWHLWYFCSNVRLVVSKILKVRQDFPMDKDIEDIVDVDPYSTI